jgi:dihydropteroate synthase
VSALTFDPRSAEVVAAAGVPVVLMHHQGAPETMQDAPRYDDVLVEVYLWLEERIAAAEAAGIARDNGSSSIRASASARSSRTISS